MSTKSEAPWKAGEKAVIGLHRLVTIDRVTASGRAVVGDQTFNADGSLRGGEPYGPRLRLLTPEIEAQIALDDRAREAGNAASAAKENADVWIRRVFGGFSRKPTPPLADIERAERLAAAIAEVLEGAT